MFWVYDRSPEQIGTRQLVEKSLAIVVSLIKFSSFPLLRPARKRIADLLLTIYGEQPPAEAARSGS